MIGLVALAFVAGSILTGTMASAEKGGVGDNLIVDALNNIATAITGIEPNVTVDSTPVTVNVDPTPITINAPQGEKGDKGDTGAKGDKGDTGDFSTLNVYKNSKRVDNSDAQVVIDVSCDSGDQMTGSGYESSTTIAPRVLTPDFPIEGTVRAVWTHDVQPIVSRAYIAYALCLDTAAPFR